MESHYFTFFADAPAATKFCADENHSLTETEIVSSIEKVLSLYLETGSKSAESDRQGSRVISKLCSPLPGRVYGLIYTKAEACVNEGALPFPVWDYVVFIADTHKRDEVKISYKYDAQLRLSAAYKLLYYLAERHAHLDDFDERVDEFAQICF